MSDSGGTRLTVDDNDLYPSQPAVNPLAPYGYEHVGDGYYPPLPPGVHHRWAWQTDDWRPYASGLPKLAEQAGGRRFAKPSDVFGAAAEAAGRYGGHLAQGLWDAGPGAFKRVMEGDVQPGTEEFNQLGAQTGMAYGVLGLPIPRPYGSLGAFGAWHGTGARFTKFDNEFIGAGEGHQSYGQGMYVGGHIGTGKQYQETIGGRGLVPADEMGMPLTGVDLARKYYEPGTIVGGYGGSYNKINSFHEHPDGRWSVKVQEVVPDTAAIAKDPQYGQLLQDGMLTHNDLREKPEFWRPAPQYGYEREHSTMPDDRHVAGMAAQKGWEMRPKGHLMDVWVKPDHDAFLDWDTQLAGQSPQVLKILKDNNLINEHNLGQTGEDFYYKLADRMQARETFEERNRAPWMSGRERAVLNQRRVSDYLESIGIPGNRYLDQFSRGKKDDLFYSGSEPLPKYLDFYLKENHESLEGLRSRIDRNMDFDAQLSTNRHFMLSGKRQFDKNAELTAADHEQIAQKTQQWILDHQNIMDWLAKNEGDFKVNKVKKTHNYVVFNPENLEVKAIDNIPVSRFEGDPFAKPKAK